MKLNSSCIIIFLIAIDVIEMSTVKYAFACLPGHTHTHTHTCIYTNALRCAFNTMLHTYIYAYTYIIVHRYVPVHTSTQLDYDDCRLALQKLPTKIAYCSFVNVCVYVCVCVYSYFTRIQVVVVVVVVTVCVCVCACVCAPRRHYSIFSVHFNLAGLFMGEPQKQQQQ